MTKVTIAVEGWNAEAAVGFALAARKFASSVTLSSNRESVDGKDEIDVLTLGPEPGEEVLMAVDGRDEKDAFDALLAKLLGVIEPQRNRTAAVNGPDTADREKTTTSRRRRVAEIAALDVEEVAPMRTFSKGMRTGQFRKVRPRLKRSAHRRPEQKAGRKPTTTRRKPRKRKK